MAKGKKTGGRVAGIPNKASVNIKALIQARGQDLVSGAFEIFDNPDNQTIKLKALEFLVEHGFGKPVQQTENHHTGELFSKLVLEYPPNGNPKN